MDENTELKMRIMASNQVMMEMLERDIMNRMNIAVLQKQLKDASVPNPVEPPQ